MSSKCTHSFKYDLVLPSAERMDFPQPSLWSGSRFLIVSSLMSFSSWISEWYTPFNVQRRIMCLYRLTYRRDSFAKCFKWNKTKHFLFFKYMHTLPCKEWVHGHNTITFRWHGKMVEAILHAACVSWKHLHKSSEAIKRPMWDGPGWFSIVHKTFIKCVQYDLLL